MSQTRVVTEPQRPRALVVDDFDGAREAVRLTLDALGYEAEGVACGADALVRLAMAYRAGHLGLSVLEKPFSLTALQTAIEEASSGRK